MFIDLSSDVQMNREVFVQLLCVEPSAVVQSITAAATEVCFRRHWLPSSDDDKY